MIDFIAELHSSRVSNSDIIVAMANFVFPPEQNSCFCDVLSVSGVVDQAVPNFEMQNTKIRQESSWQDNEAGMVEIGFYCNK